MTRRRAITATVTSAPRPRRPWVRRYTLITTATGRAAVVAARGSGRVALILAGAAAEGAAAALGPLAAVLVRVVWVATIPATLLMIVHGGGGGVGSGGAIWWVIGGTIATTGGLIAARFWHQLRTIGVHAYQATEGAPTVEVTFVGPWHRPAATITHAPRPVTATRDDTDPTAQSAAAAANGPARLQPDRALRQP